MKRFLIQIGLITIFVLGICIGLSQLNFTDEFIIYKTKDTAYKKVAWNINLINNESNRIKNSTVFLGSSLVQGGINDSLFQAEGIKAINMGVPHNGNDLWLYFLERIKDLEPKEVIILKGKTPYQGLHKLTPLLFTSSTLLKNGQGINPVYLKFLFKKTKLSLEYLFFTILHAKQDESLLTDLHDKKFGVVLLDDSIPKATFKNVVMNLSKNKNDEYYNLYKNGFLFAKEANDNPILNLFRVNKRKFVLHYWVENNFVTNIWSQERFVKRMIEIGREKGIAIKKIYIPKLLDVNQYSGYQRCDFKPVDSDSIGVLSLQNHLFLNDKKYWSDYDHLSRDGANMFTLKLIQILLKDK